MITETTESKRVELLQCGKSTCGHVLVEDEQVWVPSRLCWAGSTTGTCPKCGNDSFYHLDANGRKMTSTQIFEGRGHIDPNTIQPSPRMGLKMKRRILAAKRRALEAQKSDS
jgi:hypothetical protein